MLSAGCATSIDRTVSSAIAAIVLLLLSVANLSHGQGLPKHQGWVTDTANVLSNSARKRISDMLANYHRDTNHQLVVLTVSTLSGDSIEDFSLRVANTWGLGYKGLDNGILVTLAIKERMVRIELGNGMEKYISDGKAKAIIRSSMTPAFAAGDFAGGLENGLRQLMKEARSFVVTPRDLPLGK